MFCPRLGYFFRLRLERQLSLQRDYAAFKYPVRSDDFENQCFLNKGEEQLSRVQINIKIVLATRGIFSHSPAFFNKIRVRKKNDKKILIPASFRLIEDKKDAIADIE